MKYSYFKSISRWAGNKFAEVLGGNGRAWSELYFLPHFREEFKNFSMTHISGDITLCDTRDLGKKHYMGHGVWKFNSTISWSFETKDFKPANQQNAEILVFRFKAIKGQRQPTLRIVHQIQK